jgi:hypothetical protein
MMKTLMTCLVLLLAACGGATTSLDICHAGCDSAGRCVPEPTSQIQMCHQSCDQQAPQFIQTDKAQNGACKNAEDMRAKTVGCYHGTCDQVSSCVQQVQASCVVTQG